jgi:hypothetical protein
VLPNKIPEILSEELTEQISYSAVFPFQKISELAKIITNSYKIRKIEIMYQNVQKNVIYLFMSKSCMFK